MKNKELVLPSSEFNIPGGTVKKLKAEFKNTAEIEAYTGVKYSGHFFVVARRNFAYILWKSGGTAYMDRMTGCQYSTSELIQAILEPGRKPRYGSDELRGLVEGGRFAKHRLFETDTKTGKPVRESILKFLDLPKDCPIEDYLGYGFKWTLRIL